MIGLKFKHYKDTLGWCEIVERVGSHKIYVARIGDFAIQVKQVSFKWYDNLNMSTQWNVSYDIYVTFWMK